MFCFLPIMVVLRQTFLGFWEFLYLAIATYLTMKTHRFVSFYDSKGFSINVRHQCDFHHPGKPCVISSSLAQGCTTQPRRCRSRGQGWLRCWTWLIQSHCGRTDSNRSSEKSWDFFCDFHREIQAGERWYHSTQIECSWFSFSIAPEGWCWRLIWSWFMAYLKSLPGRMDKKQFFEVSGYPISSI